MRVLMLVGDKILTIQGEDVSGRLREICGALPASDNVVPSS